MGKREMEKTWDSKQIEICLGGYYEDRWLKFEVFGDNSVSIYPGDNEKVTVKSKVIGDYEDYPWSYDDIPIEAMRRLRDFLIYALPKEDKENE